MLVQGSVMAGIEKRNEALAVLASSLSLRAGGRVRDLRVTVACPQHGSGPAKIIFVDGRTDTYHATRVVQNALETELLNCKLLEDLEIPPSFQIVNDIQVV